MPHDTHPDEELLAALAAAEREAVADRGLVAHVAECEPCAATVADLRLLRGALAELPDITPPRPLRLIPPVPASAPSGRGIAVLLRRLSGPVMAAAVLLIVVGAVGSAASLNLAGSAALLPAAAPGGDRGREATASDSKASQQGPATNDFSSRSASPPAGQVFGGASSSQAEPSAQASAVPSSPGPRDLAVQTGTGEPPYPWLLGAGVVLLAAAFLTRAATGRHEGTGP